jgi:hypothetical protein
MRDRIGVLAPIQFNDKFVLFATEVSDERTDWCLAAKLREAPPTQRAP